ncbi:MAG: fibronectin type III domain-containing protein, partial [Planctomycetes bacterium]|nr:fibronectin type III domain-containing protein [Planctomycetota bacterium]
APTSAPAPIPPATGVGRMRIVAGGVTIEADQIVTVDSHTKRATGNVTINGVIHVTGDAVIDTKADTVTLVGTGSIYMQPVHRQFVLWDGGDYVIENGNLIGRRLKKNPLDWKLGGLDFKWNRLKVLKDGVDVGGYITLPENLGKVKVHINRLTITRGDGIKIHTRVTMPALPLAGGYSLRNTYIEFDQFKDIWEGSTTLKIPRSIGLIATVGIRHGSLNKVGFGVDYLNKLIYPAPPILIQKIYGELDHLAPGPPAITLRAMVEFTAGPKVPVGSRNYALMSGDVMVAIDVTGRIGAAGKVKIINDYFKVAGAKLIYDPAYGLYLQGELNFFEVLDMDGRMRLSTTQEFQGSLQGAVYVPKRIKIIGGIEFARTAAYVDNTEILAGLRFLWMKFVLRIDRGGQVRLGGNIRDIEKFEVKPPKNAEDLIDWEKWSVKPVALMDARAATDADPKVFHVPAGLPYTIFRMQWARDLKADFALRDPSGRVLRFADCDPSHGTYARTNEEIHEAWVSVKEPVGGTWEMLLEQGSEELGTYWLERYEPDAEPSVSLRAPVLDPVTGEVELRFDAVDADNHGDTRVSLYWDDDDRPGDGSPIAQGLDVDFVRSYRWNPAGLPSGDWRVYAKIDDGRNYPVFASAPGTVAVRNPAAPGTPEGFGALVREDGGVVASWSPLDDPRVLGYRVYVTGRTGSPDYERYETVGADQAQAELLDLAPGRRYRLSVAAVHEDGLEGLRSREVVVKVAVAGHNLPAFQVRPPRNARVGVEYRLDARAEDEDGDRLAYRLLVGPAGMTVDPRDGLVLWTPSADQVGRHPVGVQADDGRGGVSALSFVVEADRADGADAAPEVLNPADGVVRMGETYRWDVRAIDLEGQPLRHELVRGPAGMGLDVSGRLTWRPSASEVGSHDALVRVSDAAGNSTMESLRVVVVPDLGAALRARGHEGCFIATAALASEPTGPADLLVEDRTGRHYLSPDRLDELNTLRRLRDRVLCQSTAGRTLVDLYYGVGPAAAEGIRGSTTLCTAVRLGVVRPLVALSRVALLEAPEATDAAGFAVAGLYLAVALLGVRRLRRSRARRAT